jgi:hypothetical protein
VSKSLVNLGSGREVEGGLLAGGLVAGESAGHDDDHGPLDHGGVVFGKAFVVAHGAPAAVDPGETPFDGPAAVLDDEADLVGEFADDLQSDTAGGGGPVDEFALVAGVGPDQGDVREAQPGGLEQGAGAVSVLDVGAGDQDGEE